MSRSSHRVQLARAYVLHQRPFRDSSLIVEVFARDYGRMTVFARAARGPGSRFAVLQPFRALLLSWSGRGEAPQLSGAENADSPTGLPAACLMSAFYLNELLLKLVTRHDPHPLLFDQYEATLAQLRQQLCADAALRQFEARLLEFIGYGLNLAAEADTGHPVRGEAFYHFQPGVHGVVIAEPGSSGAIGGSVLQRLALGRGFDSDAELRQARSLMRAALDHCLEGRPLRTRTVARSLLNYPRRERAS
ncbi:MAG TPA: DNA repair protein RecO [Steroidobacteraceae bacterium]|nr:DNA repair protein RecO [Steroidobacteraceae bacterium]